MILLLSLLWQQTIFLGPQCWRMYIGLTDEVASLLTVEQTVGQMVDHSVDFSTDLPNETAEEVCSFLESGSACLLLY